MNGNKWGNLVCLIEVCFCLVLVVEAQGTGGTLSGTVGARLIERSRTGVGRQLDDYKIVFPTSYDGKIRRTYSTYEAIIHSQRQNFVTEMNRLGSLGYRMKFSATSDLPMSIVASDEGKFEYGWFETKSNLFFAKNRLDQNLDAFAIKGFYLADHIFIGAACEAPYPPDPVPIEKCVYTDCFIVEKGPQVKKTKQIIVSSAPGWKARPSEDLTTAINEKVSEGYYPVRAISKFEIVLEKGVNSDDVIKEKPQFQVVRTGLAGGDIKKKVNELAGQGFRLLLVDNGIAILYRNSGTLSAPASYTWVDARKKNFEKEIAKLEQTGARYCVAYPNAQGVKDSLIFETISKSAIAKEFRILRFEFDFKEDQAANKVNVDLTAASKDVVKQMNALAKEGFVVQDLFQADKISVILERSR